MIDALPGDSERSMPVRPGARASWLRPIPIVVALALTAGVILAVRAGLRSTPDGRDGQVERLTFDPGLNETPSLSSDGRLLAYASDRSGRGDLDIWVQQMGGGALVRMTDDPADDSAPDFSPDGTQIVFRSDRNNGGIYLMPALGGPARLIARDGRGPRFSPDGTRMILLSEGNTARVVKLSWPLKGDAFAIACSRLGNIDLAEVREHLATRIQDSMFVFGNLIDIDDRQHSTSFDAPSPVDIRLPGQAEGRRARLYS
jgi:hypothetical protein